MNKTFIDEIETFKINKDFTYHVIDIDGESGKIVLIDDFYENPDMVRDLAIMIPPSTNRRILNNLPKGPTSGRINAFYMQDQLGPAYDEVIKEVWPEHYAHYEKDYFLGSFRDATFVVNVMTSHNLPPRVPHTDTTDMRIFASAIYLNKPEECRGGTAFYRFGGNLYNTKCPNTLDVAGMQKPTYYLTDSNGDWELVYLAEMKWNRAIIYPGAMHHSAYVKEDWFTGDTYRLNQQFFI